MEEIKKMVEELEEIKANAEDENTVIVSKLQEIGKKFLKEYVIKIRRCKFCLWSRNKF